MLVVLRTIFVADTKITFVYNFVAPLIKTWRYNTKEEQQLIDCYYYFFI